MTSEHPLANYPRPPPRGVDLPTSDGEPMETERHAQQMWLLINTLKDAWADRDDYYVAGNMFVYFSETQARNNDFRGPDVFVVLDTVRKPRDSWVVWEEDGHTPDVVIELLSPSTEAVDRGRKKEIYARALKVGEYYLYDPFSYELEGFSLDPISKIYAPIAPAQDGSLACHQLGLRLGVRDTWMGYEELIPTLRWLTEAGDPLPTSREAQLSRDAELAATRAKAQQAEAKADRERARADALEAQIAELEARLRGG